MPAFTCPQSHAAGKPGVPVQRPAAADVQRQSPGVTDGRLSGAAVQLGVPLLAGDLCTLPRSGRSGTDAHTASRSYCSGSTRSSNGSSSSRSSCSICAWLETCVHFLAQEGHGLIIELTVVASVVVEAVVGVVVVVVAVFLAETYMHCLAQEGQ